MSSTLPLVLAQMTNFFNNPALPEISEDQTCQRQSCEGLLTKDECPASLKQMAKGKSPGSDGLSTEFYLASWESLGQDLVESLNYVFECGELTISQRRGIITLIPKKSKDKTVLDNWRPISLLTTDYKIATRAIALRISKILPDIMIGLCQKAFYWEEHSLDFRCY